MCAAHSADMDQLADEENGWFAGQHDVPMGIVYVLTVLRLIWNLMLIKSSTGGVPFGTYSIVQNFNIPIQVQPQVFMVLCLASWTQILIYGQ